MFWLVRIKQTGRTMYYDDLQVADAMLLEIDPWFSKDSSNQ
jgi:hypothetical protein